MAGYLQAVGFFDGVITGQDVRKNANTGNYFVWLGLKVSDDADQNAGETISWLGYLTDDSVENTIAKLIELAPDWEEGDLAAIRDGSAPFVGKSVRFGTKMEQYQGQDRIKVNWIGLPGSGGAGKLGETIEENEFKGMMGQIGRRFQAGWKKQQAEGPAPKKAKQLDGHQTGGQTDGGSSKQKDLPF